MERADFAALRRLCAAVYPHSPVWSDEQLESHLAVFPEGQLVAVESRSGEVVGMASALIVVWDDYHFGSEWRTWTADGFFTNHDPVRGRTLYGAEVMVDPARQRQGIGAHLYAARRDLVRRLGLRRIRAGARLRGYGAWAGTLTPAEYVERVIDGELRDPTLSFQLREGFEVVAVVGGYLRHDRESLGFAAVIEWLNPDVAASLDRTGRDRRFARAPRTTGRPRR